MKVVADSHALLFYLFTPDQLSDPALEVLGDAENTDGIVVSAATLGDLWYASHKAGERGLAPGAFDLSEQLPEYSGGPARDPRIPARGRSNKCARPNRVSRTS